MILFTPGDVDILARTIYGEAEGESRQGKIAVAHTVLNRVKDGVRWSRVVAAVCMQPRQYSCWNNESRRVHILLTVTDRSDGIFKECRDLALGTLSGSYPDPTNGANHYFNPSIV